MISTAIFCVIGSPLFRVVSNWDFNICQSYFVNGVTSITSTGCAEAESLPSRPSMRRTIFFEDIVMCCRATPNTSLLIDAQRFAAGCCELMAEKEGM